MSDFYQNGVVTVLHRLENSNIDQLKQELSRYGRIHPIALVLPSLYAELSRPALKHIVDTLTGVSYLSEIVISLDRASALEFRLAKQYFSLLPQRVRLIWNDWTRIQSILNLLVGKNLDIGLPGKGRGCWVAFGYVLARNQSQVIALHDCDIMSYNGQYVAALSYPIANPNLGYEFCKGYNNSLTFDRHEERTAVEAFLKAITLATEGFLDDPLGVPMISNWSRVAHDVPDIFERMVEAVEADHAWNPTVEPVNTTP